MLTVIVLGGKKVEVTSLKVARQAVEASRDAAGVGYSEWYRTKDIGHVYENGTLVAQVSYNGRVWPPGKWSRETKEIAV